MNSKWIEEQKRKLGNANARKKRGGVMRIALIVLLVTGCNHSFTEGHYKGASAVCAANGGLVYATVNDSERMYVSCKNGAVFYGVEAQ